MFPYATYIAVLQRRSEELDKFSKKLVCRIILTDWTVRGTTSEKNRILFMGHGALILAASVSASKKLPERQSVVHLLRFCSRLSRWFLHIPSSARQRLFSKAQTRVKAAG